MIKKQILICAMIAGSVFSVLDKASNSTSPLKDGKPYVNKYLDPIAVLCVPDSAEKVARRKKRIPEEKEEATLSVLRCLMKFQKAYYYSGYLIERLYTYRGQFKVDNKDLFAKSMICYNYFGIQVSPFTDLDQKNEIPRKSVKNFKKQFANLCLTNPPRQGGILLVETKEKDDNNKVLTWLYPVPFYFDSSPYTYNSIPYIYNGVDKIPPNFTDAEQELIKAFWLCFGGLENFEEKMGRVKIRRPENALSTHHLKFENSVALISLATQPTDKQMRRLLITMPRVIPKEFGYVDNKGIYDVKGSLIVCFNCTNPQPIQRTSSGFFGRLLNALSCCYAIRNRQRN